MNVTWEYGSGFPITIPTAIVDYIPYIYINSDTNPITSHLYYSSKNNVYNRLNPYFYKFDEQINLVQPYKPIIVKKVSMFPIMPYIGLKWEF